MTAEAISYGLLDWSVRSLVLAACVVLVVWLLRVRNPYVRLTTWTVLLVAILLMPVARVAVPALDIRIGPTITPAEPEGFRESGSAHTPIVMNGVAGPSWHVLAVGVWAGVALTFLARLATGLWLTHRMVRSSRAISDDIRESDHVTLPATVGLLRPVFSCRKTGATGLNPRGSP